MTLAFQVEGRLADAPKCSDHDVYQALFIPIPNWRHPRARDLQHCLGVAIHLRPGLLEHP